MKKLILLLFVIIMLPLFVFSQSMIIHLTKGDSTVIKLNEIKNISFSLSGNNSTVTGKWLNSFSANGTPYDAYTQLTQNGTTLTGTFEFTDGSGSQNIGSSSSINDKSINIYFLVGTYNCYFQGTVSDDFQSMSGSWYASGTYVSTWSATKTGLSKTTVSSYDVPMVEKLHELIEKLK